MAFWMALGQLELKKEAASLAEEKERRSLPALSHWITFLGVSAISDKTLPVSREGRDLFYRRLERLVLFFLAEGNE